MPRIAYVNGRYTPIAHGSVNIEDRGYQFADGVYEYFAFYNGTILDCGPHLARLERSLGKINLGKPMEWGALKIILRELIERNGRAEGGIYLQITRGVARRDHPFPKTPPRPSLVLTICESKAPKAGDAAKGVRVITHPDERWEHCDIKSISLLANVLAKQASALAGAKEAWLLREGGTVTEGAASNAYIVTEKEGIVTHPADRHILGGITRDKVLSLARENGIRVSERTFTINEAHAAQEAFLTSTSPNVLPVVQIDDTVIGNGKPGPVTQKLMQLYFEHIRAQTGKNFA